jgi:SAM-dependent methyltransferase
MLIRTISPNDQMFDARHPDAYFLVGESALRCVRLALEAASAPDPAAILDFPSGHGRVLRSLKAAFPEASVTACDIDRDGVDFCVEAFGAEGVYSSVVLDEVPLRSSFDLIWVGSLFTHLPQEQWGTFLGFLVDRLARDGLLVFTTHGPWCARQVRNGESRLGGPRILGEILHGYDETGFGFSSYPEREGYGVSLTAPAAVAQQLARFDGLRLVLYLERGWAGHQDVVACQRGYATAELRRSTVCST